MRADSNAWSYTPWVTIADGPHAIELDWRAATSPTSSDGGITFWVDGVEQGSYTNIDNDSRTIDYISLGAVSGVDTGTRGTYYFDLFESHRSTAIGLAPGAPIEPMPQKLDALFDDSFENGDLTAWSASVIDSGDLSAASEAAILGSYGLQAVLDDNVLIYVTDWRPYEETHYRARFYFDPNGIAMAHDNAHYIFQAYNRDGVVVMRIELRFAAGDYQVQRSGCQQQQHLEQHLLGDAHRWPPCPGIRLAGCQRARR